MADRIRVRALSFDWWHERTTWAGDPMRPVFDWIEEEASRSGSA